MVDTAENGENIVADETEAKAAESEAIDVVLDEGSMPGPKNVPLPAFLNSKAKWKQREQDAKKTAEAYRAENELLKLQIQQLNAPTKTLQMPTMESAGYDEEKFRQQLVEYTRNTSVEEARKAALDMMAQVDQNRQALQREGTDEEAMSRHYQAAATLKVKDFEAAEDKVIEIFGKDAAKGIITNVDDSHILVYWLGKNPEKAAGYAQMLRDNPIKGIVALADLKAKLKVKPINQSDAKPDDPLPGGGPSNASSWEKRIDAMRQKVSEGKAEFRDLMKLKQQAKEAGVKL